MFTKEFVFYKYPPNQYINDRPQKSLWAGPSLLRSSAHYVSVRATIMKIIVIIISSLVLLGIGYTAGYSKGGNDFALMDHVLMGKLASFEMKRCDKEIDSAACYKWNQENNIQHSVVFYKQSSQELSELAPYVFNENYLAYEGAVEYLKTELINNGAQASCDFLANLGEVEINKCVSESNEFISLAESSSNKLHHGTP